MLALRYAELGTFVPLDMLDEAFSCQVAEHCWDPVGHAIATYGDLFEGLIQARQREV